MRFFLALSCSFRGMIMSDENENLRINWKSLEAQNILDSWIVTLELVFKIDLVLKSKNITDLILLIWEFHEQEYFRKLNFSEFYILL